MRRRTWLGGAAAVAAGCRPARPDDVPLAGGWIGHLAERGHRLRDTTDWPDPTRTRRVAALVLGAGVAGLAAARAFLLRGIDDVHVLELDESPGGNSRGHRIAGLACPLGAHYLPLPPPEAREVREWLFEIGLLREQFGRVLPDERHLCHSPQERLFIDGQWVDGLLPPAAPGSALEAQYRHFARRVSALQHSAPGAFTLPAHRSRPSAEVAALDDMVFADWLARERLDAPELRWYLDYCCRDDFGADSRTVSAWAGIHYFASRHGFHAPGDESAASEGLFTWPEGNAWLVQRLAAPLGPRCHTGQLVHRVRPGRHEIEVLSLDLASQRSERWLAPRVVMALPLAVAARLVDPRPAVLAAAAAATRSAPWLVTHLHLADPLLERASGAPASWDNVRYGSDGLGYVDAAHQLLQPVRGATVLSVYRALPPTERAALLQQPWQHWARQVLQEWQPVHPDLPAKLTRVELMRWGHAMAVPVPGLRREPAFAALRRGVGLPKGLRIAHADLAGYSIFEEAFTAGCDAVA